MRVILTPPTPPAAGALPVPPTPQTGEPAGVTWCRDIALAVADSLGTRYQHGYHQYVRRPERTTGRRGHRLCPEALFVGFTAAAHRVDIAVVWDQPHREPGFALTVNAAPVAFHAAGRPRTAPVLARAALHAIIVHAPAPDRVTRGEPATPPDRDTGPAPAATGAVIPVSGAQ